ncbi:MAG TPA: DUF58 domain-containing protein [Pirellulales bacterium]|jgi:uncharacterized protein (DUF58 family)|nr:DUF58 domain-containing protein [Pirellulales bacterium]
MKIDEQWFDAAFLDRLRMLFFKLRKRRHFERKGSQSSPASGFTREFKDHRHYVAGDDYRSIDWRLFARLNRTFVRVFEEVQEFHVHVLLDRSQSMIEPYPRKGALAVQLALALTYLGLVNGHRVSLLSWAEELRRELPPLKGQGHIYDVLTLLSRLEFGGCSDLDGVMKQFRPGRDRRGIVFVISDLLSRRPEEIPSALKRAVAWPAETHLIQILDPAEMAPDLQGEIRLIDVETDEPRRVWLTRRETERYREAFAAWREELARVCSRNRLDYVHWTTDRAFDDMFLELLSRGSALAGK